MRPRVVGLIAWSLWAIGLALAVVGATFGFQAVVVRPDLLVTVALLSVIGIVYPTVGAFIAARESHNVVSWILVAGGVAMALVSATSGYALVSVSLHGGGLPATEVAAWAASWVFVPALALAGTFLLFLFPTGHPPSRRWHPLIWSAAAATTASAIGYAFRPGPLAATETLTNPLGLESIGGLLGFLAGAGDVVFPLVVTLGAASMLARYRAASPEERQQIKWFVYAACVMAVGLVLAALPVRLLLTVGWVIFGIGLVALPIAVAIAVMRYRLYDIDLIINRTLVYVGLVGILGGVYAASIAPLQRLFVAATGNTSDAAVVITTLILVGVFTPVRKALAGVVDRRFKPAPPANREETSTAAVTRTDLEAALKPLRRRIDALERGGEREEPASSQDSQGDSPDPVPAGAAEPRDRGAGDRCPASSRLTDSQPQQWYSQSNRQSAEPT